MQPQQIATKFIGEHVRLLQHLEKIAGDPLGFSLMCQIVDATRNGNGTAKGSGKPNREEEDDETPSSSPNGLTVAVLKYCKSIGTQITVAGVVTKMLADKYQFVAKNPKVAVADVIRRYTDKNLKITKRGEGSAPHVYKWIEAEDETV